VVTNEDDVVFNAYMMKGENTLKGGQDGCLIVLFFKGTMFELQPYHYYKNISQYFCMLWLVKTKRNLMPKKVHFIISYDVILKYNCTKKCTLQSTKKCKYIQEMIEMIFNIYEICSIY
jgi:hypothetical protein